MVFHTKNLSNNFLIIEVFRFLKPRKEKKDESWRDVIAAFVIQVNIVRDDTDRK